MVTTRNTGYLRILVLKELASQELSGYDLMDKASVLLGHKPSSGSMYPLLTTLTKEGLLLYRKEGRRKVYKLSAKGRKYIDTLVQRKMDMLQHHAQIMDEVQETCGVSQKIPHLLLSAVREGSNDLLNNLVSGLHLRDLAVEVLMDRTYVKKWPQAKAILRKAAKELEALKGAK